MRTRRPSSAATRPSFWLSISALLLAAAACAGATKETIGAHTVYVYAPAKLPANKPAPLLMLFHGSQRDGVSQIDEWRTLADAAGIVLMAPNAKDKKWWSMADDGPDLMRDMADFAGKHYRIDQRRIYAFGHSAGAVFMLANAPLESTFFAAVAVHAGQFSSVDSSGMLKFAQRKIPLFIVIGTEDPYFSVADVQQTREGFARNGFPIEVHVMEGHDHNYYARSREINDMVWKFLSANHLDADAHFNAYKIEPYDHWYRFQAVNR